MRPLARRDEPPHPPTFFESLLRRLRGIAGAGDDVENGNLRETIEELIEEAEQEAGAAIPREERALVLNALSFGELGVDDVMVPRADLRGVEVGAGLAEVVRVMRESGHSRLLVYRGTLDDVVGFVHVRDLLPYWGDGERFTLEPAVRPVHVVPPSMRVIDLLLQMRSSGNHVAVVVDEFGGTDGLVTLEDLVAELVGELHEGPPGLPAAGGAGAPGDRREAGPTIVVNADGTIDAAGRADLEEIEEQLGVALLGEDERDEADTLGGLILNLVDRVPARGEVVRHPGGFEFEVLDADPRRIKRVRIRPVPPGDGGDGVAGVAPPGSSA